MAGGSLIQMVSRNIEDMYLSGSSQVTMFKIVYRRHISFSMYDLMIDGTTSGNFSSTLTMQFENAGDLLHKIFLVVDLPDIHIKKKKATFARIANILLLHGILWDYTPLGQSEDIVTLEQYNNLENIQPYYTLLQTLNNQIYKLMNMYNFFINASIITKNKTYIVDQSTKAVNRLRDQTDIQNSQTVVRIINENRTSIHTPYLNSPRGIVFDSDDNIYIANDSTNTIIKIMSTPFVTGSSPTGIVYSPNTNSLFVTNFDDDSVVQVEMDGTSTVFADGLSGPSGITIDPLGNLYVSNYTNNTISRISMSGTVTIYARSGLNLPVGLAFDSTGNLYVANSGNNTISVVTNTGITSVFVNEWLSGPYGLVIDSNDSLYVSNQFNNTVRMITKTKIAYSFASHLDEPTGMTIDNSGNIYVCNRGNGTVTKISTKGEIGTSSFTDTICVSNLGIPTGLVFDSQNNLYITDSSTNTITRIFIVSTEFSMDSRLDGPNFLALDSSNNLYVSNEKSNIVTKITPTGNMSILATDLRNPKGLAFNRKGQLFVANYDANTISRISALGIVDIFVRNVGLDRPTGIVFDSLGYMYVANYGNSSISKITPYGETTVFVDKGLDGPVGMVYNRTTNSLYVANHNNNTISKITMEGIVNIHTTEGALLNGPYCVAFDMNNNLYASNAGDSTTMKISNRLKSLRSLAMYTVPILLTKYANTYTYSSQLYSIKSPVTVQNVDDGVIGKSIEKLPSFRNINLYTNDFTNNSFNIGIILDVLFNYSYDSLVYNANYDGIPDSAIGIDSVESSPLFGNSLTRPSKKNKNGITIYPETPDKSFLVQFKLYNSDDIRLLFYITFVNNITRLVLSVNTHTEPFNSKYKTISLLPSMMISTANLTTLNYLPMGDVLLFYHAIDNDITNYVVSMDNLGENVKLYFDRHIEPTYQIFRDYYDEIPVDRIPYRDTDSYKIYELIMKNLLEGTLSEIVTVSDIVTSQYQIDLISNLLKKYIDGNIRYIFNQILNNMQVLYNAKRTKSDHYIVSFYKPFTLDNDGNFLSTSREFTPIINNPDPLLDDHFVSILNRNTNNSNGVKNYYNDFINERIDAFVQLSESYLKSPMYIRYTSYFPLWQNLLFTSNSAILNAYTLGTRGDANIPVPSMATFGKIAYVNYVPLLSAKDIPINVYDIFKVYARHVMLNIGATVPDYDSLLVEIDMRDSFDGGSPSSQTEQTKYEIYNRIINSIIVTAQDSSSSLVVDNAEYLQELQQTQASGNDYIIVCSLRPDTLFVEYSTQNSAGNLVNSGGSATYLCMEWLTQTYYKIFMNKISIFINSLSISSSSKTGGIDQLNGILANIINCFILESPMPLFELYMNNRMSLLGLTPETNSAVQNYNTPQSSVNSLRDLHSSAISSIWYKTQKRLIHIYNNFYNRVLVSKNYYYENLGCVSGSVYDYIQNILIASGNVYYDGESTQTVPQSVQDSLPTVQTEEKAVEDNGFDFYRLKDLGDSVVVGTSAHTIDAFVRDVWGLYMLTFDYYDNHKTVTSIKNDTDNIIVLTSSGDTIVLKENYQFDKSSDIIVLLSNYVTIKYISSPTLSLSMSAKTQLQLLNDNTSRYWNPDSIDSVGNYTKNTTGVYGVLDVLYNYGLVGNLITTVRQMVNIPNGRVTTDVVDPSLYNPFTAYFLHDWYLNINVGVSFTVTYQELQEAMNILLNTVYNTSSTVPKITSKVIYSTPDLWLLYSGDGKLFPDASYVAWYLFNTILNNNTTINSSIVNSDLSESIASVANKFNRITEFTPSYSKIHNIVNFHEFVSLSSTDIKFFVQSLDGRPIINVPLEVQLLTAINEDPPKFAWVRELGHRIAKQISISIGGEVVDMHTPELMHFVHEMYGSVDQDRGYNIMIGNTEEMYTPSAKQRSIKQLYIPLHFWFCKNYGNSLPMTNLIHTDVTFKALINDLSKLLYTDPDTYFTKIPKLKCRVMARYVYLEDDERMRMAGSKLEYLVERYNYNGKQTFTHDTLFSPSSRGSIESGGIQLGNPVASISVGLTDPIKYFVWYVKFTDPTTEQPVDIIDWPVFGYNVRDSNGEIVHIDPVFGVIQLVTNGIQRELPQDETFYTSLIPYERSVPSLNTGEYMYSFALFPLSFQPTGSANFTEIPNSFISMTFTDRLINLFRSNKNLIMTVEMWGLSYNVLRVISGMCGLAFYKGR